MKDFISTRRSLLSRLKDWKDQASWKDFFDTYWRLIFNTAKQSGLSNQEAEDVVQETVLSVCKYIPTFQYDPRKCSFKTWLLRVVRCRIADQYRKRAPQQQELTEYYEFRNCDPPNETESNELEAIWDTEWKAYLVEESMRALKRKVNPKHFQIFQLIFERKVKVAEVARLLKVNRAFVYLTKHRLTRAFKEELRRQRSQELFVPCLGNEPN